MTVLKVDIVSAVPTVWSDTATVGTLQQFL